MKTMLKSELAQCAGVSGSTFKRWMHAHRDTLQSFGVSPNSKLLTPVAVRYLCHTYGIEVGDS